MPQRYIKVPDPVVLKNPEGEPLVESDGTPKAPLTLKDIILKLMHNPLWTESYNNIRAADAINRAVEKADGVIVLSEEDWKKLETAVQNPRTVVLGSGGSQVIVGLGYHPAIVTQVLPLLDAIVNASSKPVELAVPNGKTQATG